MGQVMTVGTKVHHNYPSMLDHQQGTVIANAGKKHGRQYWLVAWKHGDETRQCAFWEDVLYTGKKRKVYDDTLSAWLA